jgi:hypothetical protein
MTLSARPAGYPAGWISVALGIWLFVSPWVLGYTGIRDGAWSAWIFGVVTVILALWAPQVSWGGPNGTALWTARRALAPVILAGARHAPRPTPTRAEANVVPPGPCGGTAGEVAARHLPSRWAPLPS